MLDLCRDSIPNGRRQVYNMQSWKRAGAQLNNIMAGLPKHVDRPQCGVQNEEERENIEMQ